ncbi:MAG: hypothetical protein M1827_001834 [Pycnora praestabilis]|nr:MAG: hypothetical protein M1827_001834 [Pycnora praestabilis]
MRPSWKAALLLAPALVSAIPLPYQSSPKKAVERNPDLSYILESDASRAYAKVKVDCPGCFGVETNDEGDESLVLEVQALTSEKPCGFSNFTVNGQTLFQEWDGVEATGSGNLTAQRLNNPGTHVVNASWRTVCLFDSVPEDGSNSNGQDVAQMFTLGVHQVDGEDIKLSPGLKASFKQLDQAEILRIEASSIVVPTVLQSTEEWRNPPPHLRLSPSHHDEATHDDLAIYEDSLKELMRLNDEVRELKGQIREKKKAIKNQLKQEIVNLKEEIKQCDTIQCAIKAIVRKAHGAVKVIYIKFQMKHNHQFEMGGWAVKEDTKPHEDEWADFWPWGRHPPNMAADAHTRYEHGGPPSPHQHDTIGLANPETHSLPTHHKFRPHQFGHTHHSTFHHILKGFHIFVASVGVVSVIVFLRRCMSPRRCADRRARRAERRTKRQFRRAARRQSWRNWWNKHGRTSDYDEKRTLILEQEGILEAAMQTEIRELRNAHTAVSSLVSSEEGTVPEHHGLVMRRSDSLPDYISESGFSEPPAYDENDGSERSDFVVDGFQYSPSGITHGGLEYIQYTPSGTSDDAYQYTPSGTDNTPDSSVVETSPRNSTDTGDVRDSKDK